jgi:hypothetical protein
MVIIFIRNKDFFVLVLPAGNDPASPPYQDGVLPLYYGSQLAA